MRGFWTEEIPGSIKTLYPQWDLLRRPALSSGLASADVIHAPLPAAIPPSAQGQKLVVTVHDLAYELFPKMFPTSWRYLFRLGLRAAVTIPRGAYVTASALATPNGSDDAGAATLAPGERALEITVSNTSADELGGPGARVDVLVTTGRDGSAGRTSLALQDVQLLAARQGTGQDSDKLIATLRVTVRQAVYLTAAQNFAQEVRLLPRPVGDRGAAGRLSIGGREL